MKRRLILIACAMFGLFSLLIAHYFTLQIIEHGYWSARAAAQHELIVKEPFKRGTFYASVARQPGQVVVARPLALDVTKYHLFVDPLSIPAKCRGEFFKGLAERITIPEELRGELDRRSRSRCLIRWLTTEQKQAITSWWLPFAKRYKIASNALYFITDYQRSYPYGAMLGQALHTIQELKEEQTDQALPTGGLESFFNELLSGRAGKRKLLRSPRHRLEIDEVMIQPEDGADIYLTINPFVQAIAEEELAKGVKAAQAKGGWVVVMEAKTGHLLALAQYPFFDPSRYRDYFNDPEQIELSKVHPVTDAFELGSIMKPITVALALKANRQLQGEGKEPIFDPKERMNTTRTSFPGRGSKPLKDPIQHRALNMAMALQKSSNVYMAELADRMIQKLGSDWYRNQLIETFGFEQKTGIELPAEAIGVVPSRHRYHPNGAPEWSVPTPYSLAIGYNMLATSLQMLRAYAIFANGGYLIEPTLVEKIMRGNEVLLDHRNRVGKRVLEEEDATTVLLGMKYTTQEGGSGKLASIAGYTEAGKTGSAEKLVEGKYAKKVHLSSFIGVVPARPGSENSLVALVSIDEPAPVIEQNGSKRYMGGRCAAPVFREVMRKAVEVLGIPPDDPYGYPKGDPRYDAERADWHPEVRLLKQLYDEWNVR